MSCPHAHQQNGVAERKHRHIVEVGLALLAHASMHLKFWDEAFLTATYLINILPSKVIDFEIPSTRLFHDAPDYNNLRVFGCACWPNLRPYNSRKLSFRSTQCDFLGYSSMHKGFKCLDITTGRIYISRDVVFDEAVFPFSKLRPNAGASLRKEIVLLPSSLRNTGDDDCTASDITNTTNVPAVSSESPEKIAGPMPMLLALPAQNCAHRPDCSSQVETLSPSSSTNGAVLPTTPPGGTSVSLPTTVAVPEENSAATGGGNAVVPESPPGTLHAPEPESEFVPPGAAPDPPRYQTRLQSGIIKPKKLYDGMIRYGMFSATGEPNSVDEAISDPKWRDAMEVEFQALAKNKTWHLVPRKTGQNNLQMGFQNQTKSRWEY